MLGEFIIRVLVLVFGYAYPAFECFRSIEKSRLDIEHLLFWCQYWVILALLTALEKFGDIFVSWVPLYGESKLAFIIYLWHPKTRGTNYVYNTIVRPFMAQHETDIEKRLQGMMTKSIDVLLFYLKHFTDKGQSIAFEILQQVISRSMGSSRPEKIIKTSAEGAKRRSETTLVSSSPRKTLFKRLTCQSPRKNETRTRDSYKGNDRDDDELQLNRIEEALRAAGVNLKEISRPSMRSSG